MSIYTELIVIAARDSLTAVVPMLQTQAGIATLRTLIAQHEASDTSTPNSPSVAEIGDLITEYNEATYPYNDSRTTNPALGASLDNFMLAWQAAVATAIKPARSVAGATAVSANQMALDKIRQDDALEQQRIRRIYSEGAFVDSSRANFLHDYLYSRAKGDVEHFAKLSQHGADLAAAAYGLPTTDDDAKPLTAEQIFKLIPSDTPAEATAWAALVHDIEELGIRTRLHYRHVKTGTQGGGTSFEHVQQIEFQKQKDMDELALDPAYKAVTGYDEMLKVAQDALVKKVVGSVCPALFTATLGTAGDLSNSTTPQKAVERGAAVHLAAAGGAPAHGPPARTTTPAWATTIAPETIARPSPITSATMIAAIARPSPMASAIMIAAQMIATATTMTRGSPRSVSPPPHLCRRRLAAALMPPLSRRRTRAAVLKTIIFQIPSVSPQPCRRCHAAALVPPLSRSLPPHLCRSYHATALVPPQHSCRSIRASAITPPHLCRRQFATALGRPLSRRCTRAAAIMPPHSRHRCHAAARARPLSRRSAGAAAITTPHSCRRVCAATMTQQDLCCHPYATAVIDPPHSYRSRESSPLHGDARLHAYRAGRALTLPPAVTATRVHTPAGSIRHISLV
jgi:hypothetical protein